jgi:hypothetical protein
MFGTRYKAFNAEFNLSLTVQETDNVAYTANPYNLAATTFGNGVAFNNGNTIYHGEVYLGATSGSEKFNLAVPFKVYYYDSSGNFIKNTNDNSTMFNNTTYIALAAENTIVAADNDYNATGVITAAGYPAGAGSLLLLSPNAKGYVDVEALLGVSYANLKHLTVWDNFSSNYVNPTVRVNFGINPGFGGVIHIRENF